MKKLREAEKSRVAGVWSMRQTLMKCEHKKGVRFFLVEKDYIYLSREIKKRNQTFRIVDSKSFKEKFPFGKWCEERQWVIFGRYAGSRFKIDGGEVRILNDDEIIATVPDPEAILHQF